MIQLLFTVFNIYRRHPKFSEEEILREEYLNYRMDLFEKYTYPSVKNQTKKDFEWYVFFDVKTPSSIKDRVMKLQTQCNMFKPIFLDIRDTSELSGVVRKEILSKYEGQLVATRCDNDDALAEDYLAEIYKAAEDCDYEHETAISFENGFQYDEKQRLVCDYKKWNNHFFSLCGLAGRDHLMLMCTEHEKIKEKFELKLIKDTLPMWLEIAHGENCGNSCHLSRRTLTFDFDMLKRFKCNTDFPLHNKAYHVLRAAVGSVQTLL